MLHLIATIQTMFLGAKERLSNEEKGATMVEYGLMVALIAIVAIVGVTTVGDNLLALFEDVAAELPSATT